MLRARGQEQPGDGVDGAARGLRDVDEEEAQPGDGLDEAAAAAQETGAPAMRAAMRAEYPTPERSHLSSNPAFGCTSPRRQEVGSRAVGAAGLDHLPVEQDLHGDGARIPRHGRPAGDGFGVTVSSRPTACAGESASLIPPRSPSDRSGSSAWTRCLGGAANARHRWDMKQRRAKCRNRRPLASLRARSGKTVNGTRIPPRSA